MVAGLGDARGLPVIHARALVDASCEVGEGTHVWQFASVIRKSRIGPEGSVGACSIIDGSRIGARARIGHGAQIHPGVVAGDDLFLGPGAIICNDMWPWMDPAAFDIAALVEGRELAVIIEDRVTIGAGAIVLPGARLCEGSVVAAGAVVKGVLRSGYLFTRQGTVERMERARASRMLYAA